MEKELLVYDLSEVNKKIARLLSEPQSKENSKFITYWVGIKKSILNDLTNKKGEIKK